MMFIGACVVVALAGACAGVPWRWEDEPLAHAQSVRIDTKVRFIDDDRQRYEKVQADEIKEPSGFGSGRFLVHAEPRRQQLIAASRDGSRRFSDGTLDSLQYCKCVSTPECTPRMDLPQACASGMFLCCYKRPSKADRENSEFFNEIDDERPMLLPNNQNIGSPFPPLLTGPNGPTGSLGPRQNRQKYEGLSRPFLVGPDGPTGQIGPNQRNTDVLVGPGGPSGLIGPNHRDDRVLTGPGGPTGGIGPDRRHPAVLVGPSGPSGHIGPQQSSKAGILVGPDGPTGQIGPQETAQRGVLIGPGGPTGVLGPRQYGQRQVLVGPGGPTGLIGPSGRGSLRPYGNQNGPKMSPGLLIGPGGPTGIIGPGRRLLVGPGGPTGHIGPRGYGQSGF